MLVNGLFIRALIPSLLVASVDNPLEVFFDLVPTGAALYAPVYDAHGEVVDFRFVRLNPAGQRLLGLPAQPPRTLREYYPNSMLTGIFAQYRTAYLTGQASTYDVPYEGDGLDTYFRLVAQRSGELLVVNFTDMADLPCSEVEQSLRESRAREQAARAEAEAERQHFYDVLMQLPASVATNRGPAHVYELVNPRYQQLFQSRHLQGLPLREALPELPGQGIIEKLDRVYATGEAHYDWEQETWVDVTDTGQPEQRYYNVLFQPLRDAHGQVDGLLNFAYDVTEQVAARRQLQQLNQELETRVAERTRQLEAAQATTERQRQQWEEVFLRAPAAICILKGPEWVYEFMNPGYKSLFPGRAMLGKPLLEALPELQDQPLLDILHHVYDTGELFVASEVLVPLARTEGGPVEDIYFDLTYQARYTEAGQVDGLISYASDVTAQVLARREREAQQGELQRIFEQAPVAIAVFRGPEHIIELANDLQLAIWDRSKEEALGKGLFELLPEVVAQGFEQILAGVMTTGQPYVGVDAPASFTRHGVREEIFVSFVHHPLREADGRISGVVAVITDTTEQVRARQRVEQLNQELEGRVAERTQQLATAQAAAERERGELERVFEQAPVAIAVFRGPNYIIELVNPMLARLWGRTREQLLGKGVYEALPEAAGLGYEELMNGVMATGVPYAAHGMESRHERDGHLEILYWNFVYVPMHASDGCINGVMVVATDTTAQVEASQKVEQLNQELETRVAKRTRQLTEQQGLLSRILGQVPAAIATVSGPEHCYTFFNDQYQALAAGRTVLGQPVADLFPEVTEQGFVTLLDQVYATGQPFSATEMAMLRHDPATGQNETRYLDFIYQPMLDGQHRPQGILVFTVDVTERVRARQQAETLQAAMLAVAQRQAQQRKDFYQILEQAPVAIMLLRAPNHRIEYVNPAYAHFFAGEVLLGRDLADAHPAAKSLGLIALLDGVYQTGETYVGHELALELPGDHPPRLRYFNFTYQAYLENDRIVGVSVFATEATEQVLARRQREMQQQLLQDLFEEAPAGIAILTGPSFVFELANSRYQRFLPERSLLGHPILEAVPELADSPTMAILHQVYEAGETHVEQSLHVQLPAATGEIPDDYYFTFVYQPRRDEHGAVDGILVFVFEVTEQVRAREQVQVLNQQLATTNSTLQATNERLTRTNNDLDTFVYTASHDLKAPITNIEGLLTALRGHLPAEALAGPLVPRLLTMMDGAVARFQQTLGHLTDVSRLQQEQDQPLEAVDLSALVEAVRLDILPELTAAAATLTVDLDSCPTIQFAAKNLRSIIYNLLSNAVKYRDAERPLLVQLRCRRAAPGHVLLEVQDNGLGLTLPQQDQLFRLFRRLHTHVSGTGVGLYMVKKLIENGGGSITVQSQFGVGSTFTVLIPVAG